MKIRPLVLGSVLSLASVPFTPLPLAASVVGVAGDHSALIHDLAESIRSNYVFADTGARAGDLLEQNLKAGRYDGLDGVELAQRLTADLQELTEDRHFAVQYAPPRPAQNQFPGEPRVQERSGPMGFQKIERLDGNIGYLDLRGFAERSRTEPFVHAAMRMLQGSDALIFDLRRNGGGDPATVQAVCSYLFDPAEPVHLNSIYNRTTDTTREYWTQPEMLESDAMADVPVWVLTSGFTFSGAEEFAYNLQTRQRATIVGERTGGGAHPVDGFRLEGGEMMVMVPVSRAINPITGDNWEGRGIQPDITAPADEALDVAVTRALETLAASDDPGVAARAQWGLFSRRAEHGGIGIEDHAMHDIAGDYGQRQIEIRDGGLWYTRTNAPAGWRRLVGVGNDTFMIDQVPGFRLEIARGSDGAIKGLRGVYQQGNEDYSAREN